MIKWNLCVLCGSRNKQQILPYTTLKTVFYNRGGERLLRGTDWGFIQTHTFHLQMVKYQPTDIVWRKVTEHSKGKGEVIPLQARCSPEGG